MKYTLHISRVSFRTFRNPLALLRASAILVTLGYGAYLLWTVYASLVVPLYFPSSVSDQQLTARQKAINRRLLESVQQRNTEKRGGQEDGQIRDPFAP